MTSSLLRAQQEEIKPPLLPIDDDTKLVTYEEVVDISGANRDQLYTRADAWFKSFFKNPANVMREADKEGGKIKGKHGFNIYKFIEEAKHRKGIVKYSITVSVKDGKYKYEITNIFLLQSPKLPVERWFDEDDPEKANNYSYLSQIHEFMNELTGDLKNNMAKAAGGTEEDDW